MNSIWEPKSEKFRFEDGSVQSPKIYLGTSISKEKVDGVKYWAYESNKYLKGSIRNVERKMEKDGINFTSKSK